MDAGLLLIVAAVVGLAALTLVIVLVARLLARWLLDDDEPR
jgi:hypothetical protein